MNSSNVCLVSVHTFKIGPIIVINNNYWTDLVSLTSQTLKLLMAKKKHTSKVILVSVLYVRIVRQVIKCE